MAPMESARQSTASSQVSTRALVPQQRRHTVIFSQGPGQPTSPALPSALGQPPQQAIGQQAATARRQNGHGPLMRASLIAVHDPSKDHSSEFVFDRVFAAGAPQEDVFDEVGKPLVEHAMQGYNACCFAYGQTSRYGFTRVQPSRSIQARFASAEYSTGTELQRYRATAHAMHFMTCVCVCLCVCVCVCVSVQWQDVHYVWQGDRRT